MEKTFTVSFFFYTTYDWTSDIPEYKAPEQCVVQSFEQKSVGRAKCLLHEHRLDFSGEKLKHEVPSQVHIGLINRHIWPSILTVKFFFKSCWDPPLSSEHRNSHKFSILSEIDFSDHLFKALSWSLYLLFWDATWNSLPQVLFLMSALQHMNKWWSPSFG